MKLKVTLGVILILLLSACSNEAELAVNNVATTIKDQAGNLRDKDNPRVLSVKNGHFENYPDKSLGDAFSEFFGDPTWKHFEADTGEQVVEFAGYMMYQETKVKARLQFIVYEDGKFEGGALSFNDVPQNELTKATLLSKVFNNEESPNDKKATQENGDTNISREENDKNTEKSVKTVDSIATSESESVSSPSTKPTEKSWPSSLYGGRIPGIPSGIDDSTITLFDSNGEVKNQIDTGSGFSFEFPNVIYYTTSRLNINGNMTEGSVTVIRFIKGHSLLGLKIGEATSHDFIEKFGEADSSGISPEDDSYGVVYHFGDYNLYINAPDEDSPVTDVLYKKQ